MRIRKPTVMPDVNQPVFSCFNVQKPWKTEPELATGATARFELDNSAGPIESLQRFFLAKMGFSEGKSGLVMAAPLVRALSDGDVEQVAAIHAQSSPRRFGAQEWIACNAKAFPRMQYYVAESASGLILGYILWTEKSGFRTDAVFELEQIAVLPTCQNLGVGAALIRQSLRQVVARLSARGSTLRAVKVNTRIDNLIAQRLYARVLGAEIVATIPSLFAMDEVVMLARDPLRLLPA